MPSMTGRSRARIPRLSVIVAVRDDEDTVGGDVRALARHLRARGLPFEILAIADGSHDTSLTLLRFLGAELPELTVLGCARSGRAFRRATAHAQGEAVLLWEADRGRPVPHAVLGFALTRLARRAAVVVRGRCVLADRMRALPVLLETTGRGDEYEARFERAAVRRGLDLEIVGRRPRRFPWALLRVFADAPSATRAKPC
jgi:glycosyltransferase involved in cell wall biosynthesis